MIKPSLLLALVICASAADFSVTTDRADGLYKAGDTVVWTIKTDTNPPASVTWTIKEGGLTDLSKGTLAFNGNEAKVSATLGKPGTLLLTIREDAKTTVYGGAAFSWQEIPVSAPAPADFDKFWKEKLAELAAIPMDVQLDPVDTGKAKVQLWKITMGNIRGSKIYGYLARPVGDAPCPAMLQVQGAGVYPLHKEWVIDPANDGWLTLNIMAHDLPVDQPASFYADQARGPLKDYRVGASNRDHSYFLRMYLACYRAVDYLASRQDWNKTTMLVQGGSQGGMQAIVAASLHPAVTMTTALVPAGCDHTGTLVGRAPGWPNWTFGSKGAEFDDKVTASTYYDTINFARKVRCPILIGMGLIDTTCPPAGICAMFNQITAPKRVVIMPAAGHTGPSDPYMAVRTAWWTAGRDGKPAPLP